MREAKRRVWMRSMVGAAAAAALMGSAWGQETLKIGLLATLAVTAVTTASVMRPLAELRRSLTGVPGVAARRTDDLLRGLAEDIATVQHSRERHRCHLC